MNVNKTTQLGISQKSYQCAAPKAQNKIAQGNALGNRCQIGDEP
jgi:hypothetical protein